MERSQPALNQKTVHYCDTRGLLAGLPGCTTVRDCVTAYFAAISSLCTALCTKAV